jgi:hypothetical protein
MKRMVGRPSLLLDLFDIKFGTFEIREVLCLTNVDVEVAHNATKLSMSITIIFWVLTNRESTVSRQSWNMGH